MVSKTFEGKSYAGDPHIWFDEENGVSAKPRRSSHLWRMLRKRCVAVFSLYVVISFTGRCDADCQVFPSLLSYLNRQGVVVENVTGRQGISNKFFTHCEVAGSELVKEGCVKLLKTNATLEWRSLNEDVLQILCAGRGRTAVVFGKAGPTSGAQMYIFNKDGFVATVRQEGCSNSTLVAECRMSAAIRAMMSKEGCAEKFPDYLFGLDLTSKMPDLLQLIEDRTVVMAGGARCSTPRWRDRSPLKIEHSTFSEISRSFEKDSGRMISFELQRFVSAGEDEDRIVGKIWSRDLTSAGFFGGRVDQISSSERCYRFERVDEIEAELSVDSIGDRQTCVRLTVRLPEDFQLRNDRARRENGWQDPRFFDL